MRLCQTIKSERISGGTLGKTCGSAWIQNFYVDIMMGSNTCFPPLFGFSAGHISVFLPLVFFARIVMFARPFCPVGEPCFSHRSYVFCCSFCSIVLIFLSVLHLCLLFSSTQFPLHHFSLFLHFSPFLCPLSSSIQSSSSSTFNFPLLSSPHCIVLPLS